MPTVTQTLNIARSQIGNVGGRPYQAAFGAPAGTAWCGYFACWVLREAGVAVRPWTGWTPAIVTWGKSLGRWKTSGPKAGDLVLFMWPTVSSAGRGTPPVCHVGIVEAVNANGSITTIEGNTSGTANGSQYNGNVVARRVRSSNIQGYVSISYDAPTTLPEDLMNSTFVGIGPDGRNYLVDVPQGVFEYISTAAELSALGTRYGSERVSLSASGVTTLKEIARRVRVTHGTTTADVVWSRTIGTIGGTARTAGGGVQMAAKAAVGEPVS